MRASVRVSRTLELFFHSGDDLCDHHLYDDAVGLSIYYQLVCPPEMAMAAYFRRSWGFFYTAFRWYHNLTRRRIPAQEIIKILGIEVPSSAWKKYRAQALEVLETPVFVRLA